MSFHLLSLLTAVGLAAVHVFSQRLRVLDGVPRSRFLSIAGGIAVAFVLLRLLPALSQGQQTLEQAAVGTVFEVLTGHVDVVVLVSVAIFYGLERLAQQSRRRNRVAGQADATSRPVFLAAYGNICGHECTDRIPAAP